MNRVLASLLFGVRPSDPATIGGVVALIARSRWSPVTCRRDRRRASTR